MAQPTPQHPSLVEETQPPYSEGSAPGKVPPVALGCHHAVPSFMRAQRASGLLSQWKAGLPKGISTVQQPGSFLEAPLRWNQADAALANNGTLPIRLHKPAQWLKQNPGLSFSVGGLVLTALLLVLGLGIKQGLLALQPATTPLEQGVQDPLGLGLEDNGLGSAFLAVSKANQAAQHQGQPRVDPFKPLVKMDWYERILDMKRKEADANTEDADPNYTSTTAGTQFPDAMPIVPNMPPAPAQSQAPALQDALRYVGVIKDKSSGNKRTVLLQYKGSEGTRLISKPEGSSFVLDGMKIKLTRANAQGVDLTIDGTPKHLQGFKPSNSNLKDKTTSSEATSVNYQASAKTTQTDKEIDQILKELDSL